MIGMSGSMSGGCPRCGAATAGDAKFCGQCGASLDSAKTRWYHNVWFVLAMLVFVLGPFGLPLVWKNPKFSRGVKWLLTLIMVVYTVWLVDLTVKVFRTTMEQVNHILGTPL
jgi:hypothetical protein